MRRFLRQNRNTFRLAIVLAIAGGLSQLPSSAEAVDMDACKATCQEYRNYLRSDTSEDNKENAGNLSESKVSGAFQASQCGQPQSTDQNPSPFNEAMSSPRPGPSGGTQDASAGRTDSGDERYDACVAKLVATWGHLGPHCEVMEAAEKSAAGQTAAIIGYGVAAGLCFLACGLVAGAVFTQGAAKAMEVLCVIAGLGALGIDIGYMADAQMAANDQGQSAQAWVGMVAGILSNVGTVLFALLSDAGTAQACWGGAFFTATALIKAWALERANNSKDESCKEINALNAVNSPYAGMDTSSSSSGSSVAATQAVGIEGVQSETQGGGNASNVTLALANDFAGVNENPAMFAQALAAVAEKDGLGGLMKKKGNVINAEKGLAQAGMSFNDFAKRVASNPANMAASIAGLPGITPKVAEMIKATDQATRDELHKRGAEGALMSAARGGGKSDGGGKKADPFAALLAAKGSAAAGKADEQAFKKEKKDELAGAPESTDIWHEGYGGTIFQLVTGRLGKNRTNVDQVEWQTPLNRALAGLPPLKEGAGAKKPAGGK